MNRHDVLIDALSQQLRAGRPLAPTWRRLAGWALMALTSGSLMALGLKHSTLDPMAPGAGWELADAGVSLVIGLLLLGTALDTSIAGRRAPAWPWFAVPLLLWLAINTALMVKAPASVGVLGREGRYCFRFMLAAGMPMIILAVAYLRRSRSLRPGRSLSLAGAGIAFVTMALLWLCHGDAMSPLDFAMHMVAAMTIMLITVALGWRWVRVV
ncbi:DUF1109 domain-containing protein [Frateuria aurantia]|uniref:DUF1109 domain-containing protein n=1 Tax=Frateuria aurantia (strain ATCC 33424 / DSM 6220 / KCTC 2777 / LMG 1558 / NBRC 3245 / NCIMB 13370) TaxID=767434 RepID=H8L579_FRAAD|nr:DUF1109 domain-containing protein [Frateuria aurantia]AFC86658.1 hypothetical protein Fraau_2290 [Frateuria aurantia DSM 6220]